LSDSVSLNPRVNFHIFPQKNAEKILGIPHFQTHFMGKHLFFRQPPILTQLLQATVLSSGQLAFTGKPTAGRRQETYE
jgi:hypothetical protein